MDSIINVIVPKMVRTRANSAFDLDFAYEIKGFSRFRVNLSRQLGKNALVIRLIPYTIKTIEELNLPISIEQFASLNGKPLALSAMEYKMLNLFLKNPKQVLTRQQLLERLWDIDEKYVDEHTLTTSISRIRSKIEADGDTYIKTVYGMGYQWTGGEKK
jgi:hypothetical protein